MSDRVMAFIGISIVVAALVSGIVDNSVSKPDCPVGHFAVRTRGHNWGGWVCALK